MSSKAFVVSLKDLDDGPRTVRQPLTEGWLRLNLADTEVTPAGDAAGQLDVTLTKSGREVLVRGSLTVTVSVPCARTLDPATYRLRPEIFLMLAPASVPEAPRRRRSGRQQADAKVAGARRTDSAGSKAKVSGWGADPELEEQDAAQDTYSGESIVLDEFLREFILLEIPMVPLREDLRAAPFEANPSPPGASVAADGASKNIKERPLDPRLSPLAELKARLEKKE